MDGIKIKIKNKHTKQIQEIDLALWNEKKAEYGRYFTEVTSIRLEDLKENVKPSKASKENTKEEVRESKEKKE